MDVKTIFLSVNAKNFGALSQWWSVLLQRNWDSEPMPSCHEWNLADGVLFQVLDSADDAGTATVTLRITDLDAHVARMRLQGMKIPDPSPVPGFGTLRYTRFSDPEGNEVGLLEGS